ncbi:histidine utilization repressor [Mesorhizobium sp. B2-3-4]|uniref:histidine utilization repressor n=1 Tax=Mesorhizobium sp. B2-3-4 TaxID=2589959 RepID=UPI00112B6EB7|nr:histidine utilization repressor [Mesorhizobium sp. B2-3-4]TPM40706.1 histidine utilization repressor [Mesorhizobium sp. B2-3-4]
MIDLPDTASPLYEKVKDYILTNIGTGRWGKDRKLPSENELVVSLGVSRMTVHRALRELTAAGFLIRLQGVGTFIAPPRPQSTLIEINNIAAEIVERGNRHRSEVLVLETIMPTKELALSFEFSKRGSIYHSVVVNFENDLPVQLEERFVNPALIPDYDKQDFTRTATYDYLMQKTPVTEVEHIISAIPADKETAQHLGIDVGSCCLLLHRRTWTGAVVATISKLTYAGSRYSLGSRYSPSRTG